MSLDINIIINELTRQLNDVQSEAKTIEIKNIFYHKYIDPLREKLSFASINQKKEVGILINATKKSIDDIVNNHLSKIIVANENKQHVVNYDLSIDTYKSTSGSLNPLTLITNDIIDFFVKMNFKIVSGTEVVPIKYNFDYLNINKNHPARTPQESFYIDDKNMLRVHCTAVTAMILENNKEEDIRVVTFGNVYRNDEDDATHSHQFNQVDIVWVKEGINLRNLKWLLTKLLKHLFGNDTRLRFRLSHFPFTEPSFEVDISCFKCKGQGCNICKHSGWIEILGAGMLHPNVLKAANINIRNGIAAGLGIDRIAMLKYGISDIRDLYSNDFRILEQFTKLN